MTPSSSPLRALAANRLLRREAAALALYRLAEFGPWVAMLVFAYAQGGATTTGLVSLALLLPTALFAPFAGPLIDRFGASRVLLGAYLVRRFCSASPRPRCWRASLRSRRGLRWPRGGSGRSPSRS